MQPCTVHTERHGKLDVAAQKRVARSGIDALRSNLTGPLPRAGAVISIAAGGTLYALGQSDVSRLAMLAMNFIPRKL